MSIFKKIVSGIFEDEDITYCLPKHLYESVAKKTNKDKIDYEDVLSMSIELWLHESDDIRYRYLNLKISQIEQKVQKRKTLVIDNTRVYFDAYKVYPHIEVSKNIYQVRVDYKLQGLTVASSVEFDLKELGGNDNEC